MGQGNKIALYCQNFSPLYTSRSEWDQVLAGGNCKYTYVYVGIRNGGRESRGRRVGRKPLNEEAMARPGLLDACQLVIGNSGFNSANKLRQSNV